MGRYLVGLCCGFVVAAFVFSGTALAAGNGQSAGSGKGNPGPNGGAGKVTICHATASAKNPYVTITVSKNSTDYKGHLDHTDDLIPAPTSGCPKKQDECPNISGHQSAVPKGKIKNSSGNCVAPPPPLDVCPNIPGAQAAVPTGKIKDSAGSCVTPPPPPPPPPTPPPTPVTEPLSCTPWVMRWANHAAGVDVSCSGSPGAGYVSIVGDPVVYTDLPGSTGTSPRLKRTYEIGYGYHSLTLANGTRFEWDTYAANHTIKWLSVTKGGSTYTAIGLASGATPKITTTLTTAEMFEFETALFACASSLHLPIAC